MRWVRVVPFPPEAESVLRRCEEAGVVVDFVRVAPDAGEEGELAHRRAALAAVAEATRRHAGAVEANIADASDSREREELAEAARSPSCSLRRCAREGNPELRRSRDLVSHLQALIR